MQNTNAVPPRDPLRYDPSLEEREDEEQQTAEEMVATMRKISETVYKDEGHAYRSVHAKSHGLLFAQIEILDGLPAVLAQGIFARPGQLPVVMRLSTVPGDLLDDSISTPRGVAIKVIGVEGERVPGTEDTVTQDFVMVNGPVFSVPTARKFLKNLKLLASTTDKAPGLKKALSATFRGIESLVEKAGGESATLKSLGGHPLTNILGETFYTQVPILFGHYMAKLSLAPVSAGLLALKDAPLDTKEDPDAIRDAVIRHFAESEGVWELRVQLCTDLTSMPIEDASVQWPEDASPYVTVARITALPQVAWSAARSTAVDDGMAFSPWHAVAAHRPLGSIMRVRKLAYDMAARFRSERNAGKVSEPRGLHALPD